MIIVQIDWEAGKDLRSAHMSKAGIQGTAWGLALHPEGLFDRRRPAVRGAAILFFWKLDQKDEFHSFKSGQ